MAYGVEHPLPTARHIDVPSLSGLVASSAGFTPLLVELTVRGWWGFATSGVELLVVDLHNNNQLCIPPTPEGTDTEPTIVCTMGLRDGR